MSADASLPSIESALTGLVVNCPELTELEARLARFNLFKVLRADRNELRHSNILAWLLQPEESHGLGDTFLRRWLIRVMHDAAGGPPKPVGWLSPIDIDTTAIDRVEVHRELANIDVLIEIHRTHGAPWIIAIENKVESGQHSAQLARYREIVNHRYAGAAVRAFVFLTKNGDEPEDTEFISTTYDELADVLAICLKGRDASAAQGPLHLLNHYHELLTDNFMSENESTKLAQAIYLRHKRALDFIFESKADVLREASDALNERVVSAGKELSVLPEPSGKGYIRFLPLAWDLPSNRGGYAWGPNSRYLLCEVCLWTKKAELHITSGRAPDAWADEVWALAANPPFKQEWKKRPAQYVKPYKARSDILVAGLEELSRDDMGAKLFDWLKGELEKPQFKDAVQKLATLLPKLVKS